ncbi:PREDICTED: uracil phosphoribosyltransferase homolog [Ficedula albicollis]|nr:PREDICTED: uracil phosphoribosyltransferase homolog [Ficedula albicollis]
MWVLSLWDCPLPAAPAQPCLMSPCAVCLCCPSGEAMEQGLRDCCRSIRIGKILIQSDEETQRAKVYYAKFPPDIYRRKVLLMYPILSTGNTVIEAVKVLVEHGVQPSVIILLSLFSTPHGEWEGQGVSTAHCWGQ